MDDFWFFVLNIIALLFYLPTNVVGIIKNFQKDLFITINFYNRCMLIHQYVLIAFNIWLGLSTIIILFLICCYEDLRKCFSKVYFLRIMFLPLTLSSFLFLFGEFFKSLDLSYASVAGGIILVVQALLFWLSAYVNFSKNSQTSDNCFEYDKTDTWSIKFGRAFVGGNVALFLYYFLYSITQLVYSEEYGTKDKAISIVFQLVYCCTIFGLGFKCYDIFMAFYIFAIYLGIFLQAMEWKNNNELFVGDCVVSGILAFTSIPLFIFTLLKKNEIKVN